MNENQSRWEALIAGIGPDRSSREILFDPMVEDWAFAGLSDAYREEVRKKRSCRVKSGSVTDDPTLNASAASAPLA